jgi:ethanolamine utilization microcompartment shell protein EutS
MEELQNKTAPNESLMVVLVSENRTKMLLAAYSLTTSTDTRISYIHRYSGVVVVYIDRA